MKRVAKLPGRAWMLGLVLVAGISAIFFSYLTLRSGSTPPAGRERELNVLLITVDTLRADAPGYAGQPAARTPTIDRLAEGGARFLRAYAHNTITLPSHANILTGRLPFEHGVRDNGARLPADVETLATILKSHGYRTGAFVSAYPVDSRFGLARGFDVYDDRFTDAPRPAFLEQERSGQATVALARRWIDSGGTGPYLCWVHIYEPHFPYQPDYLSDVAAADRALAPLLEPILDEGDHGRTLVVLTGDHGESLGEHGEATHGIFAYEATLRVPLILYAPRLWGAQAIESTASHVDLLPTILDAFAIRVPPDLAGRTLLPEIETRAGAANRPVYFEAMSGALNRGWAPLRGVVNGKMKFIDLPIPEMYDLAADPSERNNLASAQPEQVRVMRALLARWPDAARPATASAASAETRERLRSLGYVSSSAPAKPTYTEEDDPKRLIGLDAILQDVVTRYLEGDLRGALQRCRELVARRPTMPISLLYLAQLSRESGDLSGGIDALRRALALNPGDPQAASLLAAYLTDDGRAAEAVKILEPFARAVEPDTQVLMADGLALARAGRPGDGLAALERARAADPSNGAILVHIGTVHLMTGRTAEATRAFEQALALNPALARAHGSLGALAAERGDSSAALAQWRQAVAIDPGEFRTVLAVSISLVRRGRAAEARPYFEFFASSAPADRYAADVARAREWLSK